MKLFKKIAGFILAFAMILAIAMPSVVKAAGNVSLLLQVLMLGILLKHTRFSQVIYQKTASHYLISLGVVV